jgi:hypothetical protein
MVPTLLRYALLALLELHERTTDSPLVIDVSLAESEQVGFLTLGGVYEGGV